MTIYKTQKKKNNNNKMKYYHKKQTYKIKTHSIIKFSQTKRTGDKCQYILINHSK